MGRLRFFLLVILSLLFGGWHSVEPPGVNNQSLISHDTLSAVLGGKLDSIFLHHSQKLPFGSTPSLQIYNDSLLISSYNTEAYTDFEREANEFFGIDEKFFDTDIYLIDKNQQAMRLFSRKINSPAYENHPAISADGKLLVFSLKRNIKSQPQLYYSIRKNGKWKSKKKLVFENYKEPIYATFPHLSGKNDLYFVSTKGNDTLDLDIFSAEKKSQSWSAPENLGPTLNTSYNEISPVKAGDSLLFFASDRPGGFGGFDLYVGRLIDTVYHVANVGEPFNTEMDELYFLAEGNNIRKGYIVRYTDQNKITPDLFSYYLSIAKYAPVKMPDEKINDVSIATTIIFQTDSILTNQPEIPPKEIASAKPDTTRDVNSRNYDEKNPLLVARNETLNPLMNKETESATENQAEMSTQLQKVKLSIEILEAGAGTANYNSAKLVGSQVIELPGGNVSGISLKIID